MGWMLTGYASVIYAAMGVWGVIDLPSHPKPGLGALALFLLIPGIVIGEAFWATELLPARYGETIREGIKRSGTCRAWAFGAGLVAGIATVGLIVLGYYSAPAWETGKGAITGGVLVLLTVLNGPPLAAALWLHRRFRGIPDQCEN